MFLLSGPHWGRDASIQTAFFYTHGTARHNTNRRVSMSMSVSSAAKPKKGGGGGAAQRRSRLPPVKAAADAKSTSSSSLPFALPPPMSPVDRLWLDVLWELDRERGLGQAPPGRAVLYREGMPLARMADDDDDRDGTMPRETRRPRVVVTDDAVEVALAVARLSVGLSTSSNNNDSDEGKQRPLHPMLAVSAHAARRWAATDRAHACTKRAASAEGGVLLRTNAWNGLRPVALDPQRQTLAELLGEGALDDLPITNRELADDEACVVTGVAARRTLQGEPCALSSRADLDVVAYPRPSAAAVAGRKGGIVAAVDAHLGLVFQTAQMFGKDAVVVCIDLEMARDPQACVRAGEVGARALRDGAFRDVVFVVPPADAPAIAVDALGARRPSIDDANANVASQVPPSSSLLSYGGGSPGAGGTNPDVALFTEGALKSGADMDDLFAFASCEPPPSAEEEKAPQAFFSPPLSPRGEEQTVQTFDIDGVLCRGPPGGANVAPPPGARGGGGGGGRESRNEHGHGPRPRIVFEVHTQDASADLDDRLDEWQFCGGAQKTFPLLGSSGGSDDTCSSRQQQRKPTSPEERQVSIRLVRHLARALLATLATRAVPHTPGAYAWASIDVDAPVARVILEVRAVSVA